MKNLIILYIIFLFFSSCARGCKRYDISYEDFYLPNVYTWENMKDTLNLGDTLLFSLNIPDDLNSFCESPKTSENIYIRFEADCHIYDFKTDYDFKYVDIINKNNLSLTKIGNNYQGKIKIVLSINNLSISKTKLMSLKPSTFLESYFCQDNYLIIKSNFIHNKSNGISFYLNM